MCYYDQDVYAGCKCRVWGDFRRECDVANTMTEISNSDDCDIIAGGPLRFPWHCNTKFCAQEIVRQGICLSCVNGFAPDSADDDGTGAQLSNIPVPAVTVSGEAEQKGTSIDALKESLRASASGFQAGHHLLKNELDIPSERIPRTRRPSSPECRSKDIYDIPQHERCSTDQILARSPPELPDFDMDLDIPSMPSSYAGPAEHDISWLLALNEDIDSLEEYISNREEGDPQASPDADFDPTTVDPSKYTLQLSGKNYDPLEDPDFGNYFDYNPGEGSEQYEGEGDEYDEYEYEEPTYVPSPRRSRKHVVAVTRRFHLASRAAHSKILRAARSNNTSQLFSLFVRSLGSHSNLLKHGFDSLDRLLSGFSIHSLRSVYSFLHVAYAMSMTDPSNTSMKGPARCKTHAEFKAGLDTLRECLDPADAEETETVRELFDEIVSVMWDEIDFGIAWFGRQTGWPFSDWCQNAEARIELAREGLKTGTMVLGEVEMGGDGVVESNYDRGGEKGRGDYQAEQERWEGDVPEGHGYGYRDRDRGGGGDDFTPTWLNIVQGTIFLIVIAFLRALDNLGEFFAYLSGRHGQDKCLGEQISCDLAITNPFRKYFELATSQFVAGVKEHVVDSLRDIVDEKSRNVLELAMDMVNRGMVSTLRDFENYVVGLSRLVHQHSSEHVDFVFKVLWQCTASCERIAPPYRVKRENHPAYDESYISMRVADEDIWHSSAYIAPPPVPTPPPVQPPQPVEQSPAPSGADATSPSTSSVITFSRYATSASSVSVSPPPSMTTPGSSSCSPTYTTFPIVLPSNAPTPAISAHSASVSPSASVGWMSIISTKMSLPPTNRKSGLPKLVGQKLTCDICGMVIRGSKSSSSKSNLLRHKKVMHDPNPVLFECGWPGCSYRQKRKDNVKAHRRKEHGCK